MQRNQSNTRTVHAKLIDVLPEQVIDKNSPIPLHYQLERFPREEIGHGRFQPRETLPAEQELQEYFDLSRTPVRQAVSNLANGGFVMRRRSQGTVVLPRAFEEELQSLSSFTEEVIRQGKTPRAELIQFQVQTADQDDVEQLGVAREAQIFQIMRLRFIDADPVGFITSHIPVATVPRLRAEDFQNEGPQQSTYYILEHIPSDQARPRGRGLRCNEFG